MTLPQPDYLLVRNVLDTLNKHLGGREPTRALLQDLLRQPMMVGNREVTALLWYFLNQA